MSELVDPTLPNRSLGIDLGYLFALGNRVLDSVMNRFVKLPPIFSVEQDRTPLETEVGIADWHKFARAADQHFGRDPQPFYGNADE